MMRVEFIDNAPPASPRRYVLVSYDAPGCTATVTGYGRDDYEMVHNAVERLLLATERARRLFYRSFRRMQQQRQRAAHLARVRASVEAARTRRAAA